MRQSRNNSLPNLVDEISEVILESEDSREKQERHQSFKSEHNFHVYQKQARQNSMDIDILKE